MNILPQILLNGFLAGSVMALAALGLSLIYGTFKFMNFAHGEMTMLGAMTYYFFFVYIGWDIVPSILMVIIVSSIIGTIFNKIIFEPMRRENAWTLMVTSVGVAFFIKGLITLIGGTDGRNYNREGYESTVYKFLDGALIITDYQIIMVIVMLFALVGIWLFLKYSKLGKSIRAVSDNEQLAAILGINTKKVLNKIFIISVSLAGLSGVLIGYEQNVSPNMGMPISIFAFVAVILGGLGHVWGAVLGAITIGVLQNLVVGLDWWGYSIPTVYKGAVAFFVLILLLIFRPHGLFGSKLKEESLIK